MAFQTGTTASSDARRDLLTSYVAMATSQHVSAAAVNAGGSGYVVGDVLTITHAGAYHDCRLEVTSVSTGAVTGVKILDGGAFSSRVATVAINAGGSGYAAGDIVRFTAGTFTEFGKVKVDTVSGGVATAISVFETGGAYTVGPGASGAATSNDIGTGSGSGLTVNTTMTGLIGTTGAAATGGTGSSATFDLSLTATGWSATTAKQNQNNYSYNGITDEKEVVLRGTVVGGDEPLIGIRTYTHTSGINTYYGWVTMMMDDYNDSLTLDSQLNVQPQATPSSTTGCYLLMFDDAQDYWLRMDGRSAQCVVKAVGASTTSYNHSYLGLLDPYGTATEVPYPAYVSGCAGDGFIAASDPALDYDLSGPTECIASSITAQNAYVRQTDGQWFGVMNVNSFGTTYRTNTVSPLGYIAGGVADDSLWGAGAFFEIYTADNTISRTTGGVANAVIMPTLGDDEVLLFPATVISTSAGTSDTASLTTEGANTVPRGDISGIFWCPATDATGAALVAEDVIDVASQDYILFQNAHRTERYSYFALKRN